MRSFTDRKNRTWQIDIDVTAIKRVRGLTGVYLPELINDGGKPLNDLVQDIPKLVDVLYALCQDQVERAGIDDEEFGRGFSGDALEKATEAFVEEIIDFFPNKQARESLRKLMKKSKEVSLLLLTKAEKQIDQLDLDSLAEKWMSSSGGLPASSASTQAPSPSGN
ncbi:MAG: hypothetical protein KatS3mg105_3303 [Gemmatales bacterium]|nr:MAG: hypothetical protein KatS3mg105_3303 [Gemmatales bacterium]